MADETVVWELKFDAPSLGPLQEQVNAVSESADKMQANFAQLEALFHRVSGASEEGTQANRHHAEAQNELGETVRTSQEALNEWAEKLGEVGGIQVPSFITGLNLANVSIAGLVTALAAGTAELTSYGAEFQHTFTSLAAAAAIPVTDVNRLRDALAGLNVPFSSMEMAQSLTQVIGRIQQYTGETMSAQQATELMAAASDLAVASGQSLSSSTNALTQQMIASKTGFEDVEHVSDVLFNTTRLTGASLESLTMAMGRIEARSGTAAPSIDQVATMVDILSNAGLSGNRAMMLMFQAIEALENPSDKASHAFETLGVEVAHTSSGQLDAIETLKNIKTALHDIQDPAERHAAAMDIMGNNYGLLESLIAPTVEQIDAMHDAISESNTAHEAAEKHADDLKERLEKLGKQATDTAGNIGTTLVGALVDMGTSFDEQGRHAHDFLDVLMQIHEHSPTGFVLGAIGAASAPTRAPMTKAEYYAQFGLQEDGKTPLGAVSETESEGTTTFSVGGQFMGSFTPAPAEAAAAPGTYESADEAKARQDREKFAADYNRSQQEAAAEAARQQRQEQERMAEQVGAYTEKYGTGSELGGSALENLEREADLRQRQFAAQQEINQLQQQHEDMLEQTKRDYEDIDVATKQQREDEQYAIQQQREADAYTLSQARELEDHKRELAQQEADYELSLARQKADYDKQTARDDSDYAKQTAREDADYQIQEGRRVSQEATQRSRQERDANISDQRQLQDMEREHTDRIAEIRKSGGANMDQQIQQENESFNKQMENFQLQQSRRREDDARHRADQEQDEARARYLHEEDTTRTRGRNAEDRAERRSNQEEDRSEAERNHREDMARADARYYAQYGIRDTRHAEDVATAQGYHAEDTERTRGYAATDLEEQRRRADELRDDQRAFSLSMTQGAGGARDDIEHAYGIAPDQIARANAERQRQQDYAKLLHDLTKEQADYQERIAAAAERAAAARERVVQEYTSKGGNEGDLAPSVVPGAPGGPSLPSAPSAPTIGSLQVNAPIIGNLGRDQSSVLQMIEQGTGEVSSIVSAVTGGV